MLTETSHVGLRIRHVGVNHGELCRCSSHLHGVIEDVLKLELTGSSLAMLSLGTAVWGRSSRASLWEFKAEGADYVWPWLTHTE